MESKEMEVVWAHEEEGGGEALGRDVGAEGRQRKTWRQCAEDLAALGIGEPEAMDTNSWKHVISCLAS